VGIVQQTAFSKLPHSSHYISKTSRPRQHFCSLPLSIYTDWITAWPTEES